MRKLGKKLVAVAGVIAMLMIILVYGFTETSIPGIVYLAMWCVCAAAICYGTDTHLPPEIVEIGEHYDGI